MISFIKFIITILGGILIGFGIGILIDKSGVLAAQYRDTAMAISLIAGGFFVALGIPSRSTDKDIIEPLPPVQPQQQHNG
jgi:NhaP-type Na+/H+ or K+/H+ antiporter